MLFEIFIQKKKQICLEIPLRNKRHFAIVCVATRDLWGISLWNGNHSRSLNFVATSNSEMCVRRSNVNIMAISVWVGGNLAVVVVVFWYWRALPKSRGICNLVIADYWSGQKSPFLLSSSSQSNSRETRGSFLGPILDEIPNWAEEDFVTNCEFWIESDSYCRAAKVGHFYDFLHSVNWRTLLGVVVVATAGRQAGKSAAR